MRIFFHLKILEKWKNQCLDDDKEKECDEKGYQFNDCKCRCSPNRKGEFCEIRARDKNPLMEYEGKEFKCL